MNFKVFQKLTKIKLIIIIKLLTGSIKLFFKRPPEMQKILGKVFKSIIENEIEDIDLKDRAVFYYKSLLHKP